MKYIDLTFPTPAENLACDEALLDLCEEGDEGELLRFWQPIQSFVVVGYANRAAVEANLPVCEAHQIRVLRRCSGGGTVLQGPGCLNYSLILRIPESGPLQGITGTNQFIMERQRAALQSLVQAPIEIQGHTDLAIVPPVASPAPAPARLKFSGNAQRRKRRFLIFHGTFLLHFDLSLVEMVLPMPSKQPDYRDGRPHSGFLTNLEIPADKIKSALRTAWRAKHSLQNVPLDRIRQLVASKYSTSDWNFRF